MNKEILQKFMWGLLVIISLSFVYKLYLFFQGNTEPRDVFSLIIGGIALIFIILSIREKNSKKGF
ncbi:hypothetical protein [Metabacillus fastidiosus]|uniref:hypothetical protein n=1 Tax=Metabacillus fastidiosus TaxID=1458 RepID=UPI003D2A76B7